MMRPLLVLLAALLESSAADTTHFRYQRAVSTSAAGESCAVLDPGIYGHAQSSLADLRLRTADGQQEIPYVLTLSEPAQAESEPAQVINLGQRGRALVFDLRMPRRVYTDVVLDLQQKDFLASATVTAAPGEAASGVTQLGEFTLFDLSSQHLSRSTVLHLEEANFPMLHVVLTPVEGHRPLTLVMLRGAMVPPSREAQTLYTAALAAGDVVQMGKETRARFHVPAHLPIERVRVALAPSFRKNFSRRLRVAGHADGETAQSGEEVSGTIERVHLLEAHAKIQEEQLAVPATLGANLQGPAEVEVAIENGDDAPLPVEGITLETRQRDLCFDAPDTRSLRLVYGDRKLEPAVYDYAQTFHPEAAVKTATLGPEEVNPGYKAAPDTRALTERHPRLVYLGLIIVVCLLGVVALRSAKLRV